MTTPFVSIVVDALADREAARRTGEAAVAAAGGLACEVLPAEGPSRASARNAAARAARGAHLAFLHGGAAPEPGWLAPLLEVTGQPGGAVAGSRLLTPGGARDGLLLAYAAPYPLSAVPQPDTTPLTGERSALDVPAVSGAALALPAALFAELGGFDERFRGALEDVDLCLRAAASGRPVRVARASRVRHAPGPGAPGPAPDPDALLLSRRWLGRVPLLDLERLREQPRQAPREKRPPLSIVVPFEDAALTLPRTVEALLAAMGPGDELVLADAGARDGSAELAGLLALDAPAAVRVVVAGGREAAVAAGLAAARRDDAAVLHPGGPAGATLLDDTTHLLEVREGSLVAIGAPQGTCAVGPTGNLRQVPPAAFLDPDPARVEAAAEGTALVIR